MNSGPVRSPWYVRVYTIVLVSILVTTSAGAAPTRITIDPTMTKGPTGAPVTIVEFSDYQ